MGWSIFLESAGFPRTECVQRAILDPRVCGQVRVDDYENLVRGLALEIFQPFVELLSRLWINKRSIVVKVTPGLCQYIRSQRVCFLGTSRGNFALRQ